MKQQKGSIYRRHGFWVLRYRETVNVAGTLEIKQRAKQICPWTKHIGPNAPCGKMKTSRQKSSGY